ncbi:MAG TPA: hypothetical protein VLL08_12530, partial [Kineosporiaceae bacterium]|nr:hypothetical protein [Kineosporiaceae bacterium]
MASGTGDGARSAEVLTNYATTAYAGAVVAVGVLLLWAITALDWFGRHSTTQAVLEELGGLLITTGVLAILWDLRGKRDIMREVLAKTELSSDVVTTGISRAS